CVASTVCKPSRFIRLPRPVSARPGRRLLIVNTICFRMETRRCDWARSEAEQRYHDTEWGVPQHDDRVLFEFLILEGAQAGLSWETILRKREAYRRAFDRFDPVKVARYNAANVARLLTAEGILRNRLKIASAIGN